MDIIKRIEAAREKEAAKKERLKEILESLEKKNHLNRINLNRRREKVNRSLANKQARPLVDLVTGKYSERVFSLDGEKSKEAAFSISIALFSHHLK